MKLTTTGRRLDLDIDGKHLPFSSLPLSLTSKVSDCLIFREDSSCHWRWTTLLVDVLLLSLVSWLLPFMSLYWSFDKIDERSSLNLLVCTLNLDFCCLFLCHKLQSKRWDKWLWFKVRIRFSERKMSHMIRSILLDRMRQQDYSLSLCCCKDNVKWTRDRHSVFTLDFQATQEEDEVNKILVRKFQLQAQNLV